LLFDRAAATAALERHRDRPSAPDKSAHAGTLSLKKFAKAIGVDRIMARQMAAKGVVASEKISAWYFFAPTVDDFKRTFALANEFSQRIGASYTPVNQYCLVMGLGGKGGEDFQPSGRMELCGPVHRCRRQQRRSLERESHDRQIVGYKLRVRLKTDRSGSNSETAALVWDEADGYRLIYSYRNNLNIGETQLNGHQKRGDAGNRGPPTE
jgi:hypothetical protein